MAPTRRILGEIVLITGSILLAFALEAWWAERTEQERFREVLTAVRQEFVGVREELDRAAGIHERTMGVLEELLGLMGPEPTDADMARLYPLWEEFRFTSTDVPKGVLANLLASGQAAALGDVELRARLSEWPSAVQDHVATEMMYAEVHETLRYEVGLRTPVAPGWGSPDYATAFPLRPGAVLSDFVVENLVARALHLLRIVHRENQTLGERADGILADLDQYLAEN